ncbi:MAG: DUF2796 domain-containing protein [Cyanobacteria bacterium J06648_11]
MELKGLAGGAIALMVIVSVPLEGRAEGHEERRQLDSHVHGITNLNVALEGNTLAIEMESPAANIVGFEHRPETAEQEQAIADALEQLEAGDLAFVLPDAAGCALLEADARTSFEEDDHGDHGDDKHAEHDDEHGHDEHDDEHAEHGDEHDEHADGEVHSEILADYRFECASPAQLTEMDVTLFEQFPGIEEIEVQFVGETGQTAVELTPAQSQLSF